ncbi:site-specific integrase [Roseibium sp. MMSF_3544]|uniref:tyrosine-type recombinase/integrase n=1 Tax=unclassified Roseibium TaxID=2629323 RepID=UPI00273F1757|nr:site-specific integrase [Roseibium sp. MMSF_3544]
MARGLHKLNDVQIRSWSKPGRLSDGGGLYLRVSKAGSKSWSFMWNKDGRRDEFGFGGYPAVTLAAARKKAAEFRELVANGVNLIEERKKAKQEPTFAECVEDFMGKGPGRDFKNEKHRAQWKMTLGPTYCARLQNLRPSQITANDVLAVLSPIWRTRTETARKLRGRIEKVLDNKRPPEGWRGGINPASWNGNLAKHLTQPAKLRELNPVRHHPALPYAEVHKFFAELKNQKTLSARALELLVLSACRTGEVLKAKWPEVDFEGRTWTIPAARMKMNNEHIVPLVDPAYELLQSLHACRRNEWVFPGNKRDKPLSDMVMEMLMRRMGYGQYTPHGFRSSFRDWAGDETEFAREIAEGCLAHKIGDDTEKAYRRGTAIKKRRNLLTAWANYLTGASGEVVQINQYAG